MFKYKTIRLIIAALFPFIISCIFAPVYGKKRYRNFIQQNNNISSRLKLSGFYYCEYKNETVFSNTQIKFIHPMFLYKDGTVKVFTNFDSYSDHSVVLSLELNTFENARKHFINFLNDPSCSDDKGMQPVGWGQYRIKKDTLLIKYFDYGPSNMGDRTLCESKNIILNDTTFVQLDFSCYKRYDRNEKRIYKFREYSPKPDSANWTHGL